MVLFSSLISSLSTLLLFFFTLVTLPYPKVQYLFCSVNTLQIPIKIYTHTFICSYSIWYTTWSFNIHQIGAAIYPWWQGLPCASLWCWAIMQVLHLLVYCSIEQEEGSRSCLKKYIGETCLIMDLAIHPPWGKPLFLFTFPTKLAYFLFSLSP